MANTVKITDSISSVGIINPNLRIFDIVMSTECGTSYNSYIVKGQKCNALIEVSHAEYLDIYIDNLKSEVDLDTIQYIILNHNEPDHSGALAELLKIMPNVIVVVTAAGAVYLKQITNNPNLNIQVVKDGDTIDLGGKTLKFITAPFLHWPDSMFTWLEEDNTLFPCDFFGAHYCEPYVFDYHIKYTEKYDEALKYYYDAIFGPFRKYVQAGYEKIKHLDIDFICPGHGPVLTKEGQLQHVKEQYQQWFAEPKNDVTTVPIFYTSAYGNTTQVAEYLKKGILSVIPNANVETFDLIDHDMTQMQHKLNTSDAFAVGSPTINKDAVPPIWNLLSHVDAVNGTKKPCIAFGSYGWSGEAVPNMVSRLSSLKLSVFGEGLRINFIPSDEELAKAENLGIEFAKTLIK